MGSLLYTTIADLVLEQLESDILNSNQKNLNISFFKGYVNANKINFLNLSIVNLKNGTLITNWYTKDIWSERFINYHSKTPLKYKISLINNLIDIGTSNIPLTTTSVRKPDPLHIPNSRHKKGPD